MKKTNEELIQEYREISKKMRDLEEKNRYKERNQFVPRIHELTRNLIDWGYRAGDKVERRTGRGWEEDEILEVKGSEMHFRTMILPPGMVRLPIKVKSEIKKREYEQISLFG